ncbi:hypothetical protein CB0940_11333 [Cercospora beticola]|nr:hypothetical protein CB0940_11333 [Cercospora beticola]PIA90632.1 hypothetical protein CB0940_11333 [Cercospora beticola]
MKDAKSSRLMDQEQYVDLVPGTELMIDGDSDLLVPQPSDDPHDPLNWKGSWKAMCIATSTVISITQGFGPLALAPMFGEYVKAFDSNLHDVVKFTGVCILVLGFSNFIWVPISTTFGRRPVLIFSTIICLISSIWRGQAASYNSFMGACVLNGIGAGPAESIQPAVIADIFFLRDRGFWNTLYWVAYMGVMFPETKWHRQNPLECRTSSPASMQSDSKTASSADAIEDSEKETGQIDCTAIRSASEPAATACRYPSLGKGAPSSSQWGIYTPTANPWKSVLLDVWIPWKLFAFPIVEFASFVVSWSCSFYLTLNLTQAQNFAAPPYNMSSQTIGFFNFAIVVGAMIGLATAGPLSDWVSARSTKRNGGIREPEMRLPAMIPYVLIMILGNFIVAFGYDRKWSWEIIVLIGYTCAGIQVAALPAIVTTYAVDSYKPVAGSIMVSITVNKNVWGYGFAEFITPWVIRSGFVPPIMTNMSLITLWCLFGFVFFFHGKRCRTWSKNSSVHRI